MREKGLRKTLLYFISFLILISFTSAATLDLNTLFHPLRGIDLASFYANYYMVIDAVIYLLLFLSLTQLVFTKIWKADNERKQAKMLSVGIGLALTLSMTLVEMRSHFYLGMLAPLAMIIFLLLIATLLYNLLSDMFGADHKSSAASLTYLIIYGMIVFPFSELNRWIETNADWLSAVLVIAAFVAAITLIIQLFNMLTKSIGTAGTAIKDSGLPGLFKRTPEDAKRKSDVREQERAGTIEFLVPLQNGSSHYMNMGPRIRPSFRVSGNAFNHSYDYEIRIFDQPLGGRVTGVRGNRVHTVDFTPGVAPSVEGENRIRVTAYRRRMFGLRASQDVINTAETTFIVDASPAYLLQYLTNEIQPRIAAMNERYRGVPVTGHSLVHYAGILLNRRWLAYNGYVAYAPTPMDTNNYVDARNTLHTLSHEIIDAFNTIIVTRNEDFMRLSPSDRNIIISALTDFTALRRGIALFDASVVSYFTSVPPNPIIPMAGP